MSDLSILKKARLEGVQIFLNPDGTIRATGPIDSLASLKPSLQRSKAAIVEHLRLHAALEQFRFDLVEQDIADGADAAELDRTNNMAWEIMQADALPFDQAMRIAASIVVATEPAHGVQEYVNVRALWRGLTSNQPITSTTRRQL